MRVLDIQSLGYTIHMYVRMYIAISCFVNILLYVLCNILSPLYCVSISTLLNPGRMPAKFVSVELNLMYFSCDFIDSIIINGL